jgi:hypothetical protein
MMNLAKVFFNYVFRNSFEKRQKRVEETRKGSLDSDSVSRRRNYEKRVLSLSMKFSHQEIEDG